MPLNYTVRCGFKCSCTGCRRCSQIEAICAEFCGYKRNCQIIQLSCGVTRMETLIVLRILMEVIFEEDYLMFASIVDRFLKVSTFHMALCKIH